MLKLICLLLEEIPQHPIYEHLGKSPTYKEIKRAIKNMTNDKAPGDSGITTDMVKNLPPKALLFYSELICEFWKNDEIDFDSWHTTLFTTIYKRKGSPQDRNNHRGSCLKETSKKNLSIIISQRLLSRLNTIGSHSQFGRIGCQEAQHTLHNTH
jgi:hypothetical protein